MRHAAVGVGTNFLAILAGLSEAAFHPLAAHLFGTAFYGIYRWGVSCAEPLLRLSPMGTDKGLLRHIASHRVAGETELEQRSLRTAFWLTLGTSLLLGLLAFLLAGPLAALQGKPEVATAIRWLAPSLPCSALILVLISATMAAKTMRYNLLVRGIAQPFSLLLLAGLLGMITPTLGGLCAAHVLAMALTVALAFWSAARVFHAMTLTRALWPAARTHDPAPSSAPFFHGEMVRFSVWIGVSEFLNSILQRTDIILIGLLAGPETLGIYAGAEALSRIASNIRYAFDPVASPVLSEALRLKDMGRLRYNLQLMTRWTTIITVPLLLAMMVFRNELLRFFPQAFLAAGPVLVVLLLGHLVNGTLGLTGWVITMGGRSRLILLNNLVSASSNVVLCCLLIPRMGLLGAALSSASSVALLQTIQLVEVALLYRVHPFSRGFFKALAAGAVVLLLAEFALGALDLPTVARLLLRGFVILAGYGLMLVGLGLAVEERDLARKFWRRVFG
ncbi:MAG TPA: oligosaccharide flippase family protein [Polyangia bacterium]|nr:oligosaccharide flippase family protein [Polyangia bacterium]